MKFRIMAIINNQTKIIGIEKLRDVAEKMIRRLLNRPDCSDAWIDEVM